MKALKYSKYIVVFLIYATKSTMDDMEVEMQEDMGTFDVDFLEMNVDDEIDGNPDLSMPDDSDMKDIMKDINKMMKDPTNIPDDPEDPVEPVVPTKPVKNPVKTDVVTTVKQVDKTLKDTNLDAVKNLITRHRKDYSAQTTKNMRNLNDLLKYRFYSLRQSVRDVFTCLTKSEYISKAPALQDITGAIRPDNEITPSTIATDKKSEDMATDFPLDQDLDMLTNLHSVLAVAYAGCKNYPCQGKVDFIFSKYITFMYTGRSATLQFVRQSSTAIRGVQKSYRFLRHGYYTLGKKYLMRTTTYADALYKVSDKLVKDNDVLIKLTEAAAISAGESGATQSANIRNETLKIQAANVQQVQLTKEIAGTKKRITELKALIKAKEQLIDTEVVKITNVKKTVTLRGSCSGFGWNVRGGRADEDDDKSGVGGKILDIAVGTMTIYDSCEPSKIKEYTTETRGTNFKLVIEVQDLKDQLQANTTRLMMAQIKQNAALEGSIKDIQIARVHKDYFIAAQKSLNLAVQQLMIAKTAFEQMRHYWAKLKGHIEHLQATDNQVKLAMSMNILGNRFQFNKEALASFKVYEVTNSVWITAASWLRVSRHSYTGYRRFSSLLGKIDNTYLTEMATSANADKIIAELQKNIKVSNVAQKNKIRATLVKNAKRTVVDKKTSDAVKAAKP